MQKWFRVTICLEVLLNSCITISWTEKQDYKTVTKYRQEAANLRVGGLHGCSPTSYHNESNEDWGKEGRGVLTVKYHPLKCFNFPLETLLKPYSHLKASQILMRYKDGQNLCCFNRNRNCVWVWQLTEYYLKHNRRKEKLKAWWRDEYFHRWKHAVCHKACLEIKSYAKE